jgi:hypothetical protein
MKKLYDNQRNEPDYLSWELITQFSLGENTRDEDIDAVLIASPLKTTMQKLGITQERIHHIIGTVSVTATQARSHFLSGRSNMLVIIDMFCQRKTLAGALRLENSTQFDAPISGNSFQEFLDLNITLEPSGERNSGCWGYFIIERGADLSIAYQEHPCVLELYLYSEVDKWE